MIGKEPVFLISGKYFSKLSKKDQQDLAKSLAKLMEVAKEESKKENC